MDWGLGGWVNLLVCTMSGCVLDKEGGGVVKGRLVVFFKRTPRRCYNITSRMFLLTMVLQILTKPRKETV